MASRIQELTKRQLIIPPAPGWIPSNMIYECIMGSVAYGVTSDDSDFDVYGVVIPPKDMIFPHLRGEIPGFGPTLKRFETWQQHHILDQEALGGRGREYDFSIFSVVKYFDLLINGTPNCIDSLFVPENCILHITRSGVLLRENRKMFLTRKVWHTYKGYSFSQLHKLQTKAPEGKRKEGVERYGYDLKFAYHLVRILNEVEQILIEGDLDLQRNREQLKSIRRGEWKESDIIEYFQSKEKQLEKAYAESKLPDVPDEDAIKKLLINCLEHHYGSLSNCVVMADRATRCIDEVRRVLERHGY